MKRATKSWRNDPAYHAWCGIKQRCENPKNPTYRFYGARGIRMDEGWRRDFFAFLRDLGPCPEKGMSVDRIDNNGHYEPGNCRWATRVEQMRNKRSNRLLTVGDRTQCLVAWAAEVGLGRSTIEQRLKAGWTTGAAIMLPIQPRNPLRNSLGIAAL